MDEKYDKLRHAVQKELKRIVFDINSSVLKKNSSDETKEKCFRFEANVLKSFEESAVNWQDWFEQVNAVEDDAIRVLFSTFLITFMQIHFFLMAASGS